MKNLIISGLVGSSFLLSGFWFGLRLAPMPKKPAPAPLTVATAAAKPPREAFSVATLKAASENILTVNQALQSREVAVTEREKKVQQQEEELTAERAALGRLHAHFKELYGEFQQRLQLVSDDESAQLQRQVEIFNSMDPAQSADLIRSLDDGTIVRLFSIMESKPLSKLVAAWKTKYPGDSTRLLTALSNMGRVVASNKIVLPISPLPVDANTPVAAPDANSGSSDANAAPSTDANSNAPSNAPTDSSATPTSSPDANSAAPTPDASTPAAASADANSNNSASSSPDASAPAASPDNNSATPTSGNAPADATVPPPNDSPVPDAAPSAPAPVAPPASTANPSAASTSDSTAPLDTPGETAAKASAAARNAPGSDETPTPSEFTPPPATMRLAHDKPARFAAAKE